MIETVSCVLCFALLTQATTRGTSTAAADRPAQSSPPAAPQASVAGDWSVGAFVDGANIHDFNAPTNHLFRNRGTTPRVDEFDVNMAAAYVRKTTSDRSHWGMEVTTQTGQDSRTFGFSTTAPNIRGAAWLTHLGPTNVSYVDGGGLTVQGGIFSSLIGYDSLYAKDNFSYTRPWGADYTPYLMLGVNASYPFTKAVTGTFGVLNGYWHLASANAVPSVVGQIAVKPDDRISFKHTLLFGPHQSDTSLRRWRVLSDTIVERKADRLTIALEYQLGAERVDTPGDPLALWTAAQMPIHWTVRRPWSLTVRPEVAWDRDGRWIGTPQSVAALTSTLEYRLPYRRSQTIVRLEYRVDNSRGTGGGFFTGREGLLEPTQNLLTIALILSFDTSARE